MNLGNWQLKIKLRKEVFEQIFNMLGCRLAPLELGSDSLAGRRQYVVEIPLTHECFDDSEVGSNIVDGMTLNGVLALAQIKGSFSILDLQENLPIFVEPKP